MECKAALLRHAPRLSVAVVVTYPHRLQPQFVKASVRERFDGFGSKSAPLIRHAHPVSYFGFALLHVRVARPAGHNAAASCRLAGVFGHYGVYLRGGKHCAYYLPALFCRRVGRPSGCRTYCRVLGKTVQDVGVGVPPRAKYQPRCLYDCSFCFHKCMCCCFCAGSCPCVDGPLLFMALR